MRFLTRLVFVAALAFAAKSPAQTLSTGELTVTVTDPSGGAITTATTALTSQATGQQISMPSSSTGEFRFSLLPPGAYTLKVSASGFETWNQQTTVELGQSSDLKVQLGVQAQKGQILVTGEAPLLQANNANLATTFDQQEIQNLPDPGNDMTVFAFTAPGVTMNTAIGSGNFSVFGFPSISNLFTINGTDVTDLYANVSPSGATGLMLGSNEVQEAAVVMNGYLGQYGRLAGANVNYLTKSGTNGFHGNARWQYNGRDLNANNWFNNATGTPRPFSVSNAWADSLGGPILKNKLFFFVDNEGMRYVLPGGGPVYIPTPAFSTFVLNGLTQNNPAAVPLYTKIFDLYAGASGAARAVPVTRATDPHLGCGDLADSVFGVSQPCSETFRDTLDSLTTEWLLTTRVDYALSRNDRVYLRFNTDHGQATAADPINEVFSPNTHVPSYGGQLGYTRVIGSHGVNTLLLAASYNSGVVGPANLSAALQTFPTTFGFPNGLMSTLGGLDNSYPAGRKTREWQLVDDFSFIRGHHTFKAGVSVRKGFVSTYFYGGLTSGQVIFNSFTDFVNASLARGSFYSQAFATVGAEDITFYSAGFYGQDEWRIRPNLMVTLALRFDRNSNLRCPAGCFTELADQGSFDTVAHSATIPYNQTIQTGLKNALGSIDPISPEPRAGFAWSLMKSTVLRGGVGLFADVNPGLLYDRFITNAPAESLFTTTSGLVALNNPASIFAKVESSANALQQGFAAGATLGQLQAEVPLGFTPPNFFTISKPVHTPKYAEWNVELQHALGERYLLSVNYVGNHGFDELIQEVGDNGYSRAGYAGLPTSAPDPRFGQIIALNNQGWSNFDGLVSSFKWRMNAQFAGQFSYTWSHALDICSNDCVPAPFGAESYRFQFNPLNPGSLNYTNSDYDVRHSLNASYIYTVPTARLGNSILRGVLGNWTAAGSFFVHSGYPFSIIDTAVLSKFTNFSGKVTQPILADFLGSGSYPSCATPNVACYSTSLFATAVAQNDFGNIPRNSFRGPGYFDTDLNVSKAVPILERYRLLIGASFFNILNHPNFTSPVNNVASGLFGHITSTVPEPTAGYTGASGRVIQTMVKFIF
ncbi:MAG TPA: TonB-dependent receptor [Bryobacteraceae bacterium]|nr:TonB-dependent receptor [Bryobacteraceae bacterium]